MAGKGPAPKLGDRLGHVAKDRSGPNTPGDGLAKSWAPPAPPEGGWSGGALAWWVAAVGSLAAEQAWLEEDRPKLERLMWMVDRWWRLTVDNPAEAMRMADVVRRAEVELYLSPAERARAGLIPRKAKEQRVRSGSAARLRAVGSDAVG
jgi:hypothetical protein